MPSNSDQRRVVRPGSIPSNRTSSVAAAEEALPGWNEIAYLCGNPEIAIAEVKRCNHMMGRVHHIASVTMHSINSMISALTTLLASERKHNRIEEPASFVAMLDLIEEFVAQSSSLSSNIEQRMLPLTANWVSLQTSMVSYDAAFAAHDDRVKRLDIVIDQQRDKCSELFQQLDGRFTNPGFPNLLQRRRPSQSSKNSKVLRIDKAYRACLEYEFRLSAARTEQRQWRYAEVPGILAALQEMYERRLQSVDKACVTIMEALGPHTKGFQIQLPPTGKFGAKFIAECIQSSKPAEEPVSTKYTYDLRLTLSDLIERRRLAVLSEKEVELPGQSTLSQMVLQQYSTYPTLTVPLIFHRLMEGISQLDPSISLVGAFRTTPRLSELDNFNEYLQSSQWTSSVPADMVNLYAYQLKCWLRELPYPIIPAELYIRCIELGRGPIGKDENLEEQLKEISEALPDVNVTMLKSLILLLRRCIDSNPASGETLITVFAPCLMRNPIDNDPSRMLADLAAERQFLSALIKHWKTDNKK